jgi:AAA+ superfamily predicted ATPase
MKSSLKIIFCSLLLSLNCFAGELSHGIHADFKEWLKSEKLTQDYQATINSFIDYKDLAKIYIDKVLHQEGSAWKIEKVLQYDYLGNSAPVGYREMQTDGLGTKKFIVDSGYYYISRENPAGKDHLVVQVFSMEEYFIPYGERMVDLIKVFANKDNQKIADEFVADIQKAEVIENMYRAQVMELAEGRIQYLSNMNLIGKIEWKDLILEEGLKDRSYNATEGFLKIVPSLTSAGLEAKKGVLLAGPPGTGKSLLGQVLISSILSGSLKGQASFISVSARNLQYAHSVKTLFEVARKLGPSAIFIEDIDLLGAKDRQQSYEKANAELILNELLNNIDGAISNHGVLVVGTTNRPEDVDSALRRSERLGVHLYYGPPSYFERIEFYNRFGKKMADWEEGLTVEWLSASSDQYSGSDIVEAIRLAKQYAYNQNSFTAEGKLLLKKSDFVRAFEQVHIGNAQE